MTETETRPRRWQFFSRRDGGPSRDRDVETETTTLVKPQIVLMEFRIAETTTTPFTTAPTTTTPFTTAGTTTRGYCVTCSMVSTDRNCAKLARKDFLTRWKVKTTSAWVTLITVNDYVHTIVCNVWYCTWFAGAATLHRATLNRATVKRRQFTGRHLTGATIKRSDR